MSKIGFDMGQKQASVVGLIILSTAVLTLAFSIRTAVAEPSIWFVDDDLQDCPDANYTRIHHAVEAAKAGDSVIVYPGIYTENVNVNKSLIIESSDGIETTFVQPLGPTDYVFEVTANFVNISGFTIKETGVYLHYAHNCCILENHIPIINLEIASDNLITENNVTEQIYLIRSCYGNIISNNNINLTEGEAIGVFFDQSSNNTLSRNNIRSGFGPSVRFDSSPNNNIIGNNIRGGSVLFALSNDNSILENNLVGARVEINGEYDNSTTGNRIINNNISNCDAAIDGYSLSDTIIFGNNMTENRYGVSLYLSSHNTISHNDIMNGEEYGVRLIHSYNDTLLGNRVGNNYIGIALEGSSCDILSGNSITDNDYGILLATAPNNRFCHNNFIGNKKRVYDRHYDYPNIYSPSLNIWNDSYPLGGNFWSNYNGTDFFSGPYQNDIGSDGIGDSAHIIDANNTDNYPLMGMFSSFNTSLGYDVNVIPNSTIEGFRYLESNSTIKMFVSNITSNQTCGFCRVTVPHTLMNVTNISVVIDNGETPLLYHNYTLYDNGTHRWIYFSYPHSIHEIDIIPEFSSFLILPLFMVATLLAVILPRLMKK